MPSTKAKPKAKPKAKAVDTHGSWWALSTRATPEQSLSSPGLWKLAAADGKRLVFDVPARALALTPEDLPELMSWANACLTGEADTQDAVEVPDVEARRLTARVSTFTCAGKVEAMDGRLYVDFPLLTVPEDLAPAAREWLQATLAAARRLRMVRVETCGETGTIHARVDLTGAPPAWLPGLVDQAVLCLRAAVEQLLPALTFLTTAGVDCRALEPGAPAPTNKLNKPNKPNKPNKGSKEKKR